MGDELRIVGLIREAGDVEFPLNDSGMEAQKKMGPGKDLALLLIRIAGAAAFLFHGSGILFGAFGGPGPVGFAGFMHTSVLIGYLVGLAQFCGALAMLTGIFARIGALCIAIVMVGAIQMVHWKHGFDINTGGYEYALTQLLIAVAILVAGAGKFSLAPGKIRNW